jgi:hypothetical protein
MNPHAWHKRDTIGTEDKPNCAYNNVEINANCQVQVNAYSIIYTELIGNIVKTTIIYPNSTSIVSEYDSVLKKTTNKFYTGTTLTYETYCVVDNIGEVYFYQLNRNFTPPIKKDIDTAGYFNAREMNTKFVNEKELMAPLLAFVGIGTFVALCTFLATVYMADKFAINFHPPEWRILQDMVKRKYETIRDSTGRRRTVEYIDTSYNGEIKLTPKKHGTSTNEIESVLINCIVPRPQNGVEGNVKRV